MRRLVVLIWTMFLGVVVNAEAPAIQVRIMGDVTVTTSDSLTLTAVRATGHMWRDGVRSREHDVVSCITHPNAIASKLNYTGTGRVVYWLSGSGKTTAKGPRVETVLPTLAILQTNGESLFFLAEGQRYAFPPRERSVGHVSTFAIVNVVRHDARDLRKRQETDTLSCDLLPVSPACTVFRLMPACSHNSLNGASFCKCWAINFTRSFMGVVSFHGMPQHAGDLLPMFPV